ncbi:MAG: hypothetical protein Q7S61_02360 [bacterium]|nr:hypothetical protein [bacterium]
MSERESETNKPKDIVDPFANLQALLKRIVEFLLQGFNTVVIAGGIIFLFILALLYVLFKILGFGG